MARPIDVRVPKVGHQQLLSAEHGTGGDKSVEPAVDAVEFRFERSRVYIRATTHATEAARRAMRGKFEELRFADYIGHPRAFGPRTER